MRNNKKAFFLRQTARLPSTTSQLVWSGPCPGQGPLPPPLLGRSSSTTTSGGSSSTTTSGGVLFHHHFQGVPCDLSHNALDVTCLLSRHQLMGLAWCSYLYTANPVHHGEGHMGPLWIELDRQTCVKTLPSHKPCMRAVIITDMFASSKILLKRKVVQTFGLEVAYLSTDEHH